MSAWLSRVTLARNPATTALKALIDPVPGPYRQKLRDPGKGRIMDAHHRLIWALFADGTQRDFLWRSEGQGRFLILSHRPPAADGAGLFDPPEVKPFAPELRAGDRLHFALRVNATQTRKTGKTRPNGSPATSHIDVVMDRLFPIAGQNSLPAGQASDRPAQRMALAAGAASEWLSGQGGRNGFALAARRTANGGAEPDLDVQDYSVVPLPGHVGSRRGQPQFGVMDLTGHIRVSDPDAFLAKLVLGVKDGKNELSFGFGRAKAFGCGLMLIRRA